MSRKREAGAVPHDGRLSLCLIAIAVAWLPLCRLTQRSGKLPSLEGSLSQKSGLLGRALPMDWG